MDIEKIVELLATLDYNKFLTGLIILIIVPILSNTFNTILKNKSNSRLVKTIEKNSATNAANMNAMARQINDLYKNNHTEATIEQIMFAFTHRTYKDTSSLIRSAKRLITVNHIHDQGSKTKERIRTIVSNMHNRSKVKLSVFEHNGKPVGEYFKNSWIIDTAATIEEFIYNDRIESKDKTKYTYNYDLLNARLSSNFDTMNNEFNDAINRKF